MNKTELIDAMAAGAGISKAAPKKEICFLIESIFFPIDECVCKYGAKHILFKLGNYMETLSFSIVQKRDSFLSKFKDLALDKLSLKLKELLDNENDEIKRIIILASRVATIRKRIEQINPIITTPKKNIENVQEKTSEQNNELKMSDDNKTQDWIRVIIIENTEVNGVRFPKGIQVDVTKSDSERLINSGKASLVA